MYSARDEGHPLLITGREISPWDVYVRVAPFEPQAVDLHFPEHEFSLHRLHIDQRLREGLHAGVDGLNGLIDAAQFFRSRIDMDEILAGHGDIQ